LHVASILHWQSKLLGKCRFPQQIDGRNGQRAVARPDRFAERGLEQFEAKRFLYQEEAATNLLHLHDENLSYFDDNGNVCVGKKVLAAFNKLTPDAVYERAAKFWRDRLSTDQPGRQQ
jgi:hypothetical protein